MIEGLRVEVKGSELAERLMRRAAWYTRKAEADEQKRLAVEGAVEQMRETLGRDIDDEVGVENLLKSTSYTQDTARSYIGKVVSHRRRAEFLNFFAEHLNASETYVLTEEDLVRFEILGG